MEEGDHGLEDGIQDHLQAWVGGLWGVCVGWVGCGGVCVGLVDYERFVLGWWFREGGGGFVLSGWVGGGLVLGWWVVGGFLSGWLILEFVR